MKTKQLIEKKKKEFDDKFKNKNLSNSSSQFNIKVQGKLYQEFKSFLHSFALELIEIVSEELIEEDEKVKVTNNFPKFNIEFGKHIRNAMRFSQRQHKDEIINSIKK